MIGFDWMALTATCRFITINDSLDLSVLRRQSLRECTINENARTFAPAKVTQRSHDA